MTWLYLAGSVCVGVAGVKAKSGWTVAAAILFTLGSIVAIWR